MKDLYNIYQQLRNTSVFDVRNYNKPFDYEKQKAGLDDLNYVYLVNQATINMFEANLKMSSKSLEDLESIKKAFNNNRKLLDIEKMSNLRFKSQKYRFLSKIMKEIDENEIVFLNEECFNLIQNSGIKIVDIKKVIYQATDGLLVEIYNPKVNVIFIDNDKVKQNQFKYHKYKKFMLSLCISNYMNGSDLMYLLKEAATSEFNIQNYDYTDSQLFLNEGEMEIS